MVFYNNTSGKKKITWYVGPGIYVLDEAISTTAINLDEMNTPVGQIKRNGNVYDNVYSLSDHLGNVRVTFKESGTGNGINLLSYNDYYAWGGTLPGRAYVSSDYRYGYQGQEKSADGSLWDQFELRLYNHDLGRWFAPDPYGQFHSPYIGMGNNPVNMVDLDGGWGQPIYRSVYAGPNGGTSYISADGSELYDQGRGRNGDVNSWAYLETFNNQLPDEGVIGGPGISMGAPGAGGAGAGSAPGLGGIGTFGAGGEGIGWGGSGSTANVHGPFYTAAELREEAIKKAIAQYKKEQAALNAQNSMPTAPTFQSSQPTTVNTNPMNPAVLGAVATNAARIAFNEVAVPIALSEPTPIGEAVVTLVNVYFIAQDALPNTDRLTTFSKPKSSASTIFLEFSQGKSGKHANQKAKGAASEKYQEAKDKYNFFNSKPNKSKEDVNLRDYWKKQMDHWKRKMDQTGETHWRKGI